MEDIRDLYLEIDRLRAELARSKAALKISINDIEELRGKIQLLINSLEGALALTDAMMTALRGLPGPPPTSVIVSKANFDNAMKKLLGSMEGRGA